MHAALVSPETLRTEGSMALPDSAARHLRDSLRSKPGDVVHLVDGCGGSRDFQIVSLSKREVLASPCGSVTTLPPPPVETTLFQCIAKPARMDWLLEKAGELGVTSVVPIVSERTVSRCKPGDKPDRWERILRSAIEQCGSAWATSLEGASTWQGALESMAAFDGPVLVGSLEKDAEPIADRVRCIFSGENPPPKRIGWLVGPEGDFSPAELQSALALKNAHPVTLGDRILRVETAAVFGISVIAAAARAHCYKP